MCVEFRTFGIHAERQRMFLRRLGQNDRQLCVHGRHCPQVLEKLDGNFVFVGKPVTQEATAAMLPGPGIGPEEGAVEVPREVVLSAMADFFAVAA